MRVLEYGKAHEKTLLFLPCTAEPEWAFADSVYLLSQNYHVMQIVYDGHGETGEDFVSVETTVDEIADWLWTHGITRLNAAYGCSLGGACLTRFLALGKIPVGRAVIDAGITPYQMPLILRRLACLRDYLGFRLIAKNRKVLEAAYPPERWTLPGRDPVKEYDALAAYLKTYSKIPSAISSGRRTTTCCRRSRLKRAAASLIGTAMKKRRHGIVISALSRDIFLIYGHAAFQRWITRSL